MGRLHFWPTPVSRPIPKVIIVVVSADTATQLPLHDTLLSSQSGQFDLYLPPRNTVNRIFPASSAIDRSLGPHISAPSLHPNVAKPSYSLGQGINLEALLYDVSRSRNQCFGNTRKEARQIQQLAAGRRPEHVRSHYAWSTAGGSQDHDGGKQNRQLRGCSVEDMGSWWCSWLSVIPRKHQE